MVTAPLSATHLSTGFRLTYQPVPTELFYSRLITHRCELMAFNCMGWPIHKMKNHVPFRPPHSGSLPCVSDYLRFSSTSMILIVVVPVFSAQWVTGSL